jgi:hypothetical protein
MLIRGKARRSEAILTNSSALVGSKSAWKSVRAGVATTWVTANKEESGSYYKLRSTRARRMNAGDECWLPDTKSRNRNATIGKVGHSLPKLAFAVTDMQDLIYDNDKLQGERRNVSHNHVQIVFVLIS